MRTVSRDDFFAKRFDCERLETSADVLMCSLYVDLNVIRAGIAETPEHSKYTSAYDRIRARWRSIQEEFGNPSPLPFEPAPDAWLAPIFLDERAVAYQGIPQGKSDDQSKRRNAARLQSDRRRTYLEQGFLPVTLERYLSLLDELGRVVREGKRGAIPKHLAPILERLNIDPVSWIDSLLARFADARFPIARAPATVSQQTSAQIH